MLAVAKRWFSVFTRHGTFFVTDLKQSCAHPPFGSKFVIREAFLSVCAASQHIVAVWKSQPGGKDSQATGKLMSTQSHSSLRVLDFAVFRIGRAGWGDLSTCDCHEHTRNAKTPRISKMTWACKLLCLSQLALFNGRFFRNSTDTRPIRVNTAKFN